MPDLIEIELDSSEVKAALEQAARQDLSPIMAVVAEMLVAGVNDKFDQSGPGWPALAESTLRQRRGSTAQILVDTGRLAASIRGESGADFAEVFTDVSYAVYHVSSAPRTIIPLRDFFDLPEQVFEDVADFVVEELTREA